MRARMAHMEARKKAHALCKSGGRPGKGSQSKATQPGKGAYMMDYLSSMHSAPRGSYSTPSTSSVQPTPRSPGQDVEEEQEQEGPAVPHTAMAMGESTPVTSIDLHTVWVCKFGLLRSLHLPHHCNRREELYPSRQRAPQAFCPTNGLGASISWLQPPRPCQGKLTLP